LAIWPDRRWSAVLVGEHQGAISIEPRPVVGRQVEIGQIMIAQIEIFEPGNPGAGRTALR
jgi:hypothetical protein